jgi:holin-like protein
MPIFFISPTVSIMSSIGLIKDQLFAVLLTCVVSTAVVMAVTGWVAQFVMKHNKKEEEK